ETAAKRLRVPVRMWRRTPLLTNSFARLTLAALEFCASRDVRSLMPLARTTYINLDFKHREELQAAVRIAHSRRGEQWQSLREWVAEFKNDFLWLSDLLDWRDDAALGSLTLEAWAGK